MWSRDHEEYVHSPVRKFLINLFSWGKKLFLFYHHMYTFTATPLYFLPAPYFQRSHFRYFHSCRHPHSKSRPRFCNSIGRFIESFTTLIKCHTFRCEILNSRQRNMQSTSVNYSSLDFDFCCSATMSQFDVSVIIAGLNLTSFSSHICWKSALVLQVI